MMNVLRKSAEFKVWVWCSVCAFSMLLSACAPNHSARDIYFQSSRHQHFCFREASTNQLPRRQYVVDFRGCPETPLYSHYEKGMHSASHHKQDQDVQHHVHHHLHHHVHGHSESANHPNRVKHAKRKNTPCKLHAKNTGKIYRQNIGTKFRGKVAASDAARKAVNLTPQNYHQKKTVKNAGKNAVKTFSAKNTPIKNPQKLPSNTTAQKRRQKPAVVSDCAVSQIKTPDMSPCCCSCDACHSKAVAKNKPSEDTEGIAPSLSHPANVPPAHLSEGTNITQPKILPNTAVPPLIKGEGTMPDS